MASMDSKPSYLLLKLFPPGVVGWGAAALPYAGVSDSTNRIAVPGSEATTVELEAGNARVFIKCWEISDILQQHHIVHDLGRLQTLGPPSTFDTYLDSFPAYSNTNNALQLFVVRRFYEAGTLKDHIDWMASKTQSYGTDVLDRWLIQLLYAMKWAHEQNLTLVNLSVRNICMDDSGVDIRLVDYIPTEMVPEICLSSHSPLYRDDHVLALFPVGKWTAVTDLEAIGYVVLQLSVVGHRDYPLLKLLLHPYSLRHHWATLMEAVWELHGFWWMQMIEKFLGLDYEEKRVEIISQLVEELGKNGKQPTDSVDWGSAVNLPEPQGDQEAVPEGEQHNFPDPAVLVSWIEQAWEFFQHGNQGEFQKICVSMLKSVPSDQQSTLRPYHLQIIAKLFDMSNRDKNTKLNLATLLAGLLYSDNVDGVARSMAYDVQLISLLDQYASYSRVIPMLATALAQVYHPKKKPLVDRFEDMTTLFRCAFTSMKTWTGFLPVLMCILHNSARLPTSYCLKTPLIPLLMWTLHEFLDFPCEIHLCLRMLRRLVQKSFLGACMVLRFRVGDELYLPTDVLLKVLDRHGHKIHVHRECALIAIHLWATPGFFQTLVADGWLKIFATLMELASDEALLEILRRCLQERGLIIMDQRIFRVNGEPYAEALDFSPIQRSV